MIKKIVSLLTVLMLIITMFSISVINTSALSGKIYFELPENWAATAKTVYCHIWLDKGDEYAIWQTEAEIMTKEEGNTYSFEVPEGNWDMVVFGTDYGDQTYDLCMGDTCIGDTVYVTNNMVENPMDSEKTCNIAYWTKNKDNYAPFGNPVVLGTNVVNNAEVSEAEDASKSSSIASNDTISNPSSTKTTSPMFLIIVIGVLIVLALVVVGIVVVSVRNKTEKE